MIISLAIGLILGAVTVIFALQNMTTISVVFLSWKFEGSLALILILTMAAGVVIALLMSLPELINKSFQISRLKKQNRVSKQELENKKIEVESEKSKLDANNAYLNDLENKSKIQ